mgnify:FL=1
MAAQEFDIVIAGGGLAGCLMALSLAELTRADGAKLSIAIIEANPGLKDASKSFDDRVLALSHGSCEYLKKVGIWQSLQADAEAIESIHISDRGHYGKARIQAHEHRVSALGHVVEMSLIGKALLAALKPMKNIHWFAPDTIESIDWQQENVTLALASGSELKASLLLACDGGMSACRQLANIDISKRDYGQSALIANVATRKPHQNIAYERFTETGPIAMLPLSSIKEGESRCSLVWTLTPELAEQVQNYTDSEFKLALEQAFGSWLGSITQVGKRDIYPLNLVQAKEQVYHRMALIGNASHTIHPIAGQGFNLGLRDVEQMAKQLKLALKNGQDIGHYALLSDYAQRRQKDHSEVITLTDSLVTLFSNDLPPLVVGRNIGLKVLNYLSPLKNALVKKTMGY